MNRKPIATLALFLACATGEAQTNNGTGKGLDALDEQKVMARLAQNNLETLLDRDFRDFNVPPNEQDQVKTFLKLRELINYTGNIAGRRAMALTVAKGLDSQLPKATDANVLMSQANQLASAGIAPVVTALEYFGENPVAQAELKPAAETARKMYKQVAVLADRQSDLVAKGIKSNSDYTRAAPLLRQFAQVKAFGDFSDNMTAYAVCIALPQRDPQRKALADATITYLKQFDDAKSGLQPDIRLQIGKLQLVEGDAGTAKATLDTVVDASGLTPAPSMTNQNNARYFGVVALISSRKLKDAETAIPEFERWESTTYLPTLPNPSDQAAVKAAMSMLKFRLYSAQSDITNDVDERKAKNDAAIEVLAQLLKSQPGLKDLVFDQLIGRIPATPNYAALNPLVLQALQQQGFAEVTKPADAKVDEKKLARAIEAAGELVKRDGQPGVDAATAQLSSYFIAYAYDRMKDGKHAAAAFMDFAEKFATDKDKSADAMDHATKWVGELRRKDAADQDTRKLYDRFLPLAINPPYNRRQFAFTYGALLQGESRFGDAVKYFQMVAPTEKKFPEAQYLQLLCLYKQLSEPAVSAGDKTAIASRILELDKTIDGMLANASSAADKAKFSEWVVNSDLIAADLTHHTLNDPVKSLAVLEGFENRITGAKNVSKAHLDALQMRISDYLDANRVQDAVDAVVSLLQADPAQGQGLMFDVLKTVEHEMDEATGPAKEKLAQAKATLSSFVVEWATKKNDPNLTNFQLYDADAKREAAELTDDVGAKKKGLDEALKGYHAIYDSKKDDASLQGIGLTEFDLGNYAQAMDCAGVACHWQ